MGEERHSQKSNASGVLGNLPDRFSGVVTADEGVTGDACVVEIDHLVDFCTYLKEDYPDGYDYLTSITGVDYPDRDPRFEVVYHLVSTKTGKTVQVKTRAKADQKVPSLTSLWKAALWNERETYDLMGIEFDGHPDLRRILLPDTWHGYPLRKDYVMQDPEEDLWVDEKDLR